MIGRVRKLEGDPARIAELERELGYREPESEYDRAVREHHEARAIRERERTNGARKEVASFLYAAGLLVWNPACWSHGASWLLWVTIPWDIPAAIFALVGGATFIVWLLSGRNLLGRWL